MHPHPSPPDIYRIPRPAHGGDAWRYPGTIDFSANINPLGPSSSVIRAITRALEYVNAYPTDGRELSLLLADKHGLMPENIVLGNGSSELIKAVCEVTLRPGDRVLIPQPTFSEYEYFSVIYGASTYEVPLPPVGDAHMHLHPGGFRMLFLCNPNNPTGSSISPHRIEELLEEAERAGCLVVVDEAYQEFSKHTSIAGMVESHDTLVVLRSMTKFYSIPGLRLGYAVAGERTARMLRQVLPPWNVNTVAIAAGVAALGDKRFAAESRRYISKEKKHLFQALCRLPGLRIHPSDANFFLINIEDTGMSSFEMKKKLVKKGFLIRDCSSFRRLGDRYIRICIRKHDENLKLISAMEELLNG